MGSKLFSRMSIQQRFTLVLFLGFFVPVIILCYWMLQSWKSQLVEQRHSVLVAELNQVSADVNQVSELCALSAQAFQSNRRLQEHLDDLMLGKNVKTAELYSFYQNDITSLQNIVSVNSFLYRIRVYSVCSQIDEIYPVLFGSDRIKSIGWDKPIPTDSQWWIDYTDNMFGAAVTHRMALLQPMKGMNGQVNAMLEVSADMPRLFPALFNGDSAALVTRNGQVVGSAMLQGQSELLQQGFDTPLNITQIKMPDGQALIGTVYLDQLDAVYIQKASLSGIYRRTAWVQMIATVSMVLLSVIFGWAVRSLVNGMLRQLEYVVQGVRQFSQGDLKVEIPVEGQDEIGRFSMQINELLTGIRRLIDQNVEKEVLIKNTEIRALQNQINAHFLYNVLEAIKMMAEIDERYDIADAVTSLGKLLRYTMKWNRRTVALQEELEYIDNYIALVNLRYDGQVSLKKLVPETLLVQEIPKLSLQPIVENAVIHGGSHELDREIRLKVSQVKDVVYISIQNNGKLIDEKKLEHLRRGIEGVEPLCSSGGNGIGLKNVQDRIHMTFGPKYGITVESRKEEGTTVTVSVPFGPIGQGESK